MSALEIRGFRGLPLADGALVRYIYTDEAGTSAVEPACVVAAVIVHGDDQWRPLELDLRAAVKEHVPVGIQENFIVHATEIFSGGKKVDRNAWPFASRLEFLQLILGLPRKHRVPIAIGSVLKEEQEFGLTDAEMKKIRLDHNDLCHLVAFGNCMERADFFLRRYLGGKEIGTVIAEDVPRMKRALTEAGLAYRDEYLSLRSEDFVQNSWEKELGVPPSAHEYRIDHIVDVPHFVAKDGAPLLQLADVCAFAFRRFMVGQSHGNDLLLAMLGSAEGGSVIADPVWRSCSSGLFNTQFYWDDERRAHHLAVTLGLAVKRSVRRS